MSPVAAPIPAPYATLPPAPTVSPVRALVDERPADALAVVRSALRGSGSLVCDLTFSRPVGLATHSVHFDLIVVHPRMGFVAGQVLDTDRRPLVISRKNSPALALESGRGFVPLTPQGVHPMACLGVAARALADTLTDLFSDLDPTRLRSFDCIRLRAANAHDRRRQLAEFFHPTLAVTPDLEPGSSWPRPESNDALPVSVLGLTDLVALLTAPSSAVPAFYPDEITRIAYCLGAATHPRLALAC